MKKFENCGFTSVVTNDKLKLEIPIANLVFAFENAPNNQDQYGNPATVKRGKRKQFAEWVAETIVSEADPEDGATYTHQMFDKVFDQIFEGYVLADEFIKDPVADDDY
jgi:hypothetical protein